MNSKGEQRKAYVAMRDITARAIVFEDHPVTFMAARGDLCCLTDDEASKVRAAVADCAPDNKHFAQLWRLDAQYDGECN